MGDVSTIPANIPLDHLVLSVVVVLISDSFRRLNVRGDEKWLIFLNLADIHRHLPLHAYRHHIDMWLHLHRVLISRTYSLIIEWSLVLLQPLILLWVIKITSGNYPGHLLVKVKLVYLVYLRHLILLEHILSLVLLLLLLMLKDSCLTLT